MEMRQVTSVKDTLQPWNKLTYKNKLQRSLLISCILLTVNIGCFYPWPQFFPITTAGVAVAQDTEIAHSGSVPSVNDRQNCKALFDKSAT